MFPPVKVLAWAVGLAGALVVVAGVCLFSQLPMIGAGALLYPTRRHVTLPPPPTCVTTTLTGEGLTLSGWRCRGTGDRRGTLVYLHGITDNRTSAGGIIERFGSRGFDVVAYDSRAHGESEGAVCTYGWYEKQDLHRVLDTVEKGPIVLFGTSLGAAVALQTAAIDAKVSAVVAVETFADLRGIATERAPFVFTGGILRRAFSVAEEQGHFAIDAVSPERVAPHVTVPVLLIHGDADTNTPPIHSKRVFAALAGPKQLILVPGGRHNGSLRHEVLDEIGRWLDAQLLPMDLK